MGVRNRDGEGCRSTRTPERRSRHASDLRVRKVDDDPCLVGSVRQGRECGQLGRCSGPTPSVEQSGHPGSHRQRSH